MHLFFLFLFHKAASLKVKIHQTLVRTEGISHGHFTFRMHLSLLDHYHPSLGGALCFQSIRIREYNIFQHDPHVLGQSLENPTVEEHVLVIVF
jgi:hypothetical protein